MAFEAFTGKRRNPLLTPSVSITKEARLQANRAAAELLRHRKVKHVILLWDTESLKVAIRPTNAVDDAYGVTYSERDKSAAIAGKGFCDWIGYDYSETRSFSTTWSEKLGHLEFEIPAEHFKVHEKSKPKRG